MKVLRGREPRIVTYSHKYTERHWSGCRFVRFLLPLVLASGFLIAPLGPLSAGATEELPLAYHLSLDGNGWVVVDVANMSRAYVRLQIDFLDGAGVGQLIHHVASGATKTSTLHGTDGGTWLHADSPEFEEGVDVRLLRTGLDDFAISHDYRNASHIQRLTFWAAGAASFELRIHTASPDFSISEVARGTRTWISDGTDWHSNETMLIMNRGPDHIAIVDDAAFSFEVRGQFTGLAGWPPMRETYWEEEVTLIYPDGRRFNCPCMMVLGTGNSTLEPGEYSLRRTAFGAAFGAGIPWAGADIEV